MGGVVLLISCGRSKPLPYDIGFNYLRNDKSKRQIVGDDAHIVPKPNRNEKIIFDFATHIIKLPSV